MSQELQAPSECDRVQTPVAAPNPLLEQFLRDVQDPQVSKQTRITALENNQAKNLTLDVKEADGTLLSGNFSVDRDAYGNATLSLKGIVNPKTDQRDLLSTANRNDQWLLDGERSRFARTIAGVLPQVFGDPVGDLSIRPNGDLSGQTTTESAYWKHGANGDAEVISSFNADGKVIDQIGAVNNLNKQRIQVFNYTFNPDGKATSCSRNSKADGSGTDILEFSAKIE